MKTRKANDVVGRGGRYQLIEKIGEGAVLEVWSATYLDVGNRKYALKFLKDSGNRAHLQTEIDLLQKVGHHPHIVNLHYQELEADPFVVVDLCHVTLHDILGPTGLPFEDPAKKQEVATKKARDLADAIQFVHNKTSDTIIDLDPMNVMFQQYDAAKRASAVQLLEGTIKICDLNAKVTDASIRDSLIASLSTSMRTGEKGSTHVFAKPYFIAPELLNSDAAPTFAADVYTLGKLLTIMLTGRKELNPRYMPSKMGIAPSYDEVITTAVEPNVEERFQDIGQFLEALEEAEKRPVKVTVSVLEAIRSGFSYEKARAKKEKEADARWQRQVKSIVDDARKKAERAEESKRNDARWERQREEDARKEAEKKQKEAEKEEANKKELQSLELLLKNRPDESRAAWLNGSSDITIYQVNQFNNSAYSPTVMHVPRCQRDNFEIKWIAWVNNGKHLAYCANFSKGKGYNHESRSAIGLIDTNTLGITEEPLEYEIVTDNIHADSKEPIIFAANKKGELIQFDLLNPEKVNRAKFVPIRGLRICKQEDSICGRFKLDRRYGENRKYDTVIQYKENPDLVFMLGDSSKLAVWYDPEQGNEASSEPEQEF